VSNEPVRVVLAGLQPIMAGFIRAALEQTGMSVVETTTCEKALALAAASSGIGVMIVPTHAAGFIGAYSDALGSNPAVRCLTISQSTRRADLFELRLLGADVGPCGVVEAVAAAVASPLNKCLS
jgi:DNA-binding NarL/FixJ family response regulator